MKKTVIGMLAHVDAGKTTLSEAILYCAGVTRTFGRVDHGNAFLDNFELERKRGITIFSKQALITRNQMNATLLDTPGHVDFSAETERVFDVLDCAIMVISAPEGVQSHTGTLWKLLRQRNIPTFIFVNKMDLEGADKKKVIDELCNELKGEFFDYKNPDLENLAMSCELLMNEYLDIGKLSKDTIIKAIQKCDIFPCWFGAALKLDGVEEFLNDLSEIVPYPVDKSDFAAKVYKISRDDQGNRLTHMKITGGSVKVRDIVKGENWEEKITQLRIYNGAKYESVQEAYTGDVVAVMGFSSTLPGMGLGTENEGKRPELVPVLTYSISLPEGYDVMKALPKLHQLEEEDPSLNLSWDAHSQNLQIQLMGPIQLEVLKHIILERFDIDVEFGEGQILYCETIETQVEGVGHYEPLRHYAEVHLIMTPGKQGSGIVIRSDCSEDSLDKNWQRLIMTHLAEKQHKGVLTGSPITDIIITLTAGRAHPKHTEGGDFRQATYRAVRQGLMQAKSVLLEPWYSFRMELPQKNVGRALNDLQRMGAEYNEQEVSGDYAIIIGSVPVAAIGNYISEFNGYTHGLGRFFCSFKEYAPCINSEEIIEKIGYEPEVDIENTADSVFCSHGAAHLVKWYDVTNYMHLGSTLESSKKHELKSKAESYIFRTVTDEELMKIFERTYGPIKRDIIHKFKPVKRRTEETLISYNRSNKKKSGMEYLLVDGYNIIFAWRRLKELGAENIDAARESLIDILRNYQGFKQIPVIVVFDAYKVKGNLGSVEHYGDLTVVFTKEAETADTYIERAAYKLSKDNQVRVATSDRLEQMIIVGNNALKVSAQAFEAEVMEAENSIRELLEDISMQEELKAPKNRAVIKQDSEEVNYD